MCQKASRIHYLLLPLRSKFYLARGLFLKKTYVQVFRSNFKHDDYDYSLYIAQK